MSTNQPRYVFFGDQLHTSTQGLSADAPSSEAHIPPPSQLAEDFLDISLSPEPTLCFHAAGFRLSTGDSNRMVHPYVTNSLHCCGLGEVGNFVDKEDKTRRALKNIEKEQYHKGMLICTLNNLQIETYKPLLIEAGWTMEISFINPSSKRRVYFFYKLINQPV